ncbi:MAG: biotin--[acetyl-CoA-carboxylase] ligase [Acidobacteriota bacterium]|jgi:BirA family biotin operon repressor/biotin-[acetyl-CoA-carboxylase] ligase
MDFDAYITDLDGPDGSGRRPENRVVVARTDSTNRLTRRVVAAYREEEMTPPHLLVLALEQTAGRGRRGRSWHSPPGAGVYATRLLPVAGQDQLRTVPLLAAAGLARAVRALLPDGDCGLEWPNDLVVGGRKLGGVLVESVARADGGALAMIGFGVNHRFEGDSAPPDELHATSLADALGDPPSLGSVTRALVDGLERALERVGDVAHAIALFRELSVHRAGDPIRCRTGDEVVTGTFAGFDDRGFLRLDRNGEERLIPAGEIIEPLAGTVEEDAP